MIKPAKHVLVRGLIVLHGHVSWNLHRDDETLALGHFITVGKKTADLQGIKWLVWLEILFAQRHNKAWSQVQQGAGGRYAQRRARHRKRTLHASRTGY